MVAGHCNLTNFNVVKSMDKCSDKSLNEITMFRPFSQRFINGFTILEL